MMADLGMTTQVRVWTDSNAAKVTASRRGLGKTRHVELKYLSLQEMTKSGRVKMRREATLSGGLCERTDDGSA